MIKKRKSENCYDSESLKSTIRDAYSACRKAGKPFPVGSKLFDWLSGWDCKTVIPGISQPENGTFVGLTDNKTLMPFVSSIIGKKIEKPGCFWTLGV